MASKIDLNNNIFLTRGDSFCAKVDLELLDGTQYIPVEGDVIRFACKKDYSDNTVLFSKNIPIDTLLLEFQPEDTKSLAFGEYVYDIQITMASGFVDTFIPTKILRITKEVD